MSVATVLGPIGDLRAHAVRYAELGLAVFPLWANKVPRTPNGMKDASSDVEQVVAWWDSWPDALIGCRIPPGVVVLDVDPKHNGMATWTALKDEYGALPVTRAHRSGRDDGGGHLWFRRPDGRLSARGLNRWAREHGTGQAVGKHSWTAGVDILHHNHRYTVLPPSAHLETGKPYAWIDGRGLEIEPAEMPAWLARLLIEEPLAQPALSAPRRASSSSDQGSIADWFSAHTSFVDLLVPEGWVLVSGNGAADGSRWRHPNATQNYSATVKNGCLFVYSTSTDFEPTGEGDPHGYTPFRTWALLRHGGDLSAAAREARELKDGPPASRDDWGWVTLTGGCGPGAALCGPVTVAEPEPEPEPQPWPILDEAALHGPIGDIVREVMPHSEADPVGILASLLSYFAAAVGPGPHFRLSGGKQTARLFVLVVGDSARARKGSAESIARWIMSMVDPAITIGRRMNGLNSGEGLIEAVRDPKWGRDKHGNEVLLDAGVDDKRLMLFEPEFAGRLLPAARRQGSTVSGLLRMAWDEGDLQTMNARNPLRATNAHVCLLANTTIGEFLDIVTVGDIQGGLLNRFLFVAVRSTTLLPFGGMLDERDVAVIARPLREVLDEARKRCQVEWGDSTREHWPQTYEILMNDAPPGPLGHLTARGPVQVQRLALLYALLDQADRIEREHLDAGVAFWLYCRESAELVLSGEKSLTGDPDGDRLLQLLYTPPLRPWTTMEVRTVLGYSGARLAAARARLERNGTIRVWQTPRPGGGRPTTWIEAR